MGLTFTILGSENLDNVLEDGDFCWRLFGYLLAECDDTIWIISFSVIGAFELLDLD